MRDVRDWLKQKVEACGSVKVGRTEVWRHHLVSHGLLIVLGAHARGCAQHGSYQT